MTLEFQRQFYIQPPEEGEEGGGGDTPTPTQDKGLKITAEGEVL